MTDADQVANVLGFLADCEERARDLHEERMDLWVLIYRACVAHGVLTVGGTKPTTHSEAVVCLRRLIKAAHQS